MKKDKEKPVYLDFSQPIERRIEDLLERMTLKEKVNQMNQILGEKIEDLFASFMGKSDELMTPEKKIKVQEAVLEIARRCIAKSGTGSMWGVFIPLEPEQGARTANEIQKFAIENTRLGIPMLLCGECVHGHMAKGATIFPQAIGMGSTWSPDLIQRIGSVIAEEARAVGNHQTYSPVLGIARDPRWGRTEETFGEDPYLASCLGIAMVKGLQGDNLADNNTIVASPKHFAAHSEPLGGRDSNMEGITERDLREIFLPSFKAAIKEAGAESVMTAYSVIDGVPCTASKKLLTKILREEWGFKGCVVSDLGAVEHLYSKHHIAATPKEAVKQAVEAGLDVHVAGPEFADLLLELAEEGQISKAIINQAVRRVLRIKFLLGLFEKPYVNPERAAKICDCKEHRELALEAARESIVLLRNKNNLLPLNKDIKSILITGPNADNVVNQLGDYRGQGSVITVLEGIKNRVSLKTKVRYVKGCSIKGTSTEGIEEAVEAAKNSDVAIVVVGGSSWTREDTCGEGRDRADLNLPGVQTNLIKAIYETGTPMVAVLISGRPLTINWMVGNVPAVLEAWYPGEEGGNAIADIIFGNYNPSGKLPITFPQSVGQLPLYYNHKPSGRGYDYVFMKGEPLFVFGYGLSYTEFTYSNLCVTPKETAPAGEVNISVEVQNTGDREGKEIVQLYVHDTVASVTRPIKELKGFEKILLKPGEKKTVKFTLTPDQLSFYNRDMNLVVEPGTFDVMVGGNSAQGITGGFRIIESA